MNAKAIPSLLPNKDKCTFAFQRIVLVVFMLKGKNKDSRMLIVIKRQEMKVLRFLV